MADQKPSDSSRQATFRRLLKHENFLLVIIMVALIGGFGGMTRGASLTARNAIIIMLQSSTRGLIAIGQAFVIPTAGIDLSIGGLTLRHIS